MPKAPESLTDMLDQIDTVRDKHSQVSLGMILDAVGRRSFGPLLVVAGLVVLAPVVGDIPGMPTLVGLFVLMVAVQIVIGRQHIWLPKWMLDRSVSSSRLGKPVKWLRKPAGVVDRLLKPRLRFMLAEPVVRGIAGVCLLVAVVMPVMELVPFSANAAGLVLLTFGLAIIVRDGLMAIIGAVATGAVAWVIIAAFA